MKKLLAILAAIAAAFGLLFSAERSKRKEAETEVQALKDKQEKDKAIDGVVADTTTKLVQEDKPERGKDITLFCLGLLALMFVGCANQPSLCPALSLLPRPAYDPVTLQYNNGLYCTDYDGASALANEMQRRNTIIKGYEDQIKIYQDANPP